MSIRKAILSLALMAGLVPAISFAQAPPAVPGLPDTERRASYSISAQTGPFSVGFALYGDSTDFGDWVQVYLCTSAVLNPCSQLTAVTQWTLSSPSGSLATLPRPITDATITLTTAQTGTLQIVGARRPRRTSQFAENRGVAARDLNQTITDLVAQNREDWDLARRTIQGQPGEAITQLQPAATRAGGILCWDATGVIPLTCAAGSSGTANVVGPNVSVVGHIATFGNTLGTLLTDGGLVGAGNVVGPSPSVSVANHAATWKDAGGINIKDSGLTLTPSTGTITVTNAKTLAVDNSLELAGTDSTKMTFPGASDTVAALGTVETWTAAQTFTNSTLKLLGSSTGATTLTSANSGASNFTLTVPAATDTIAELGQGNVFTGNNSFSGTSLFTGSVFSLASNGQASIGASTTAGAILAGQGSTSDLTIQNRSLATVCSIATGTTTFNCPTLTATTLNGLTVTSSTGTLTIANGKTVTINNSGTIGGGDGFTLSIAANKTATFSNSLTFTGTDATSFAFPSGSDTVVTLGATQTLTGKSLTSPVITGGSATALTGLGIRSTGSGAFDLTFANTENLTAGRTVTVTVNNANRTVSLSGNLTTAADFITSGANSLTLTTTGATNVTLPTTGTLAVQNASNTFSATNTFSAANTFSATTQFTNIKLSSGAIFPTADSTTALQITKADGTTGFVDFDSTNKRVGINTTSPSFDLSVSGTIGFTILDPTSLASSVTTITGLTVNNSPNSSNDYFLYFSAADNRIRKCTVGACASAATAGVSALNGLTGSLSLSAASGVTVSSGGTTVTLTAASPVPQGRLTLSTGVPVMTATVSGATTVYYSPYNGASIPLYDGTNMVLTAFSEVSQATTDSTKSPAAVAASKCYDEFGWNDSGTFRVTRGPAWTNCSTRGYTLTMTNGILLNTSTITNGPAALRGTWLGTIASNGSSTIDYIFGASSSGGTAAVLNVWNTYNRVLTPTTVTDSGVSYTYATATVRQARASAGNQISFVLGAQEDAVPFSYAGPFDTAASNSAPAIGVCFDVTNAFGVAPFGINVTASLSFSGNSSGTWAAGAGTHVLAACELSVVGTNTFNSSSTFGIKNMLMATIRN